MCLMGWALPAIKFGKWPATCSIVALMLQFEQQQRAAGHRVRVAELEAFLAFTAGWLVSTMQVQKPPSGTSGRLKLTMS